MNHAKAVSGNSFTRLGGHCRIEIVFPTFIPRLFIPNKHFAERSKSIESLYLFVPHPSAPSISLFSHGQTSEISLFIFFSAQSLILAADGS